MSTPAPEVTTALENFYPVRRAALPLAFRVATVELPEHSASDSAPKRDPYTQVRFASVNRASAAVGAKEGLHKMRFSCAPFTEQRHGAHPSGLEHGTDCILYPARCSSI